MKKKAASGGRGGLEPIRMRIRNARKVYSWQARFLRDSFNLRAKAINTLAELLSDNPLQGSLNRKARTNGSDTVTATTKKGRGRPKGSGNKPKPVPPPAPVLPPQNKKEHLDRMLATCNEIIQVSYDKLQQEGWKGVRPADLLAFMVLAKDIIKDLHSEDNPDASILDSWTK